MLFVKSLILLSLAVSGGLRLSLLATSVMNVLEELNRDNIGYRLRKEEHRKGDSPTILLHIRRNQMSIPTWPKWSECVKIKTENEVSLVGMQLKRSTETTEETRTKSGVVITVQKSCSDQHSSVT